MGSWMSESCSLPRIFNAARRETFEAKNVHNVNVEVGTKRFVIELELHAAWRRFHLTNRTQKKKLQGRPQNWPFQINSFERLIRYESTAALCAHRGGGEGVRIWYRCTSVVTD